MKNAAGDYPGECMHDRAYERINVRLEAMYHCGVRINSGIVTNISENGMFIHTKLDLPFDVNFELIIPSNEGALNFPVKIIRIEKSNGVYDGIGVEIADHSQSYLDYVRTLRTLGRGDKMENN